MEKLGISRSTIQQLHQQMFPYGAFIVDLQKHHSKWMIMYPFNV